MNVTDSNSDTAGIDEPGNEPSREAEPSVAVRRLDRLVGTWQLSGEASGTVTYEWMAGGYFLLQHVDLDHGGHRVRGMEVIGHLHPFMGERSEHVHSRFYGSEGKTLDYVYELDGDTLTIWVVRRARRRTSGARSMPRAAVSAARGSGREGATTRP